ncbi:Ureidoglycolate lyase [Ceratocystis fimbriata CBS 114723]|uniref:Ureidoglycolate lyase n=1 Tax=Ceratocystis fimbriata CBS 114723 TaxID=1035309 RepID=A0A2C5WU14_9PEZI|nr:Ureidoglycolate lyase [Ceratocystis fimbriata CBS 114723]
MAPLKMKIAGMALEIPTEPLTPTAFAPFGEVLQNPLPDLVPGTREASEAFVASSPLPFEAIQANQGSAIKYQHISRPLNLYAQAPSRKPAEAVVNMFVCAARALSPVSPCPSSSSFDSSSSSFFAVNILERHPYTTQTFTPLSSTHLKAPARFLIIVAPSLPSGSHPLDADLPVPHTPPLGHFWTLPGRGLPDLRKLRAFIATDSQAVTYGAGTWHAPMVALGEPGSAISFVVTQFANGVNEEDCQEVKFETVSGEGVCVVVGNEEAREGLRKQPSLANGQADANIQSSTNA